MIIAYHVPLIELEEACLLGHCFHFNKYGDRKILQALTYRPSQVVKYVSTALNLFTCQKMFSVPAEVCLMYVPSPQTVPCAPNSISRECVLGVINYATTQSNLIKDVQRSTNPVLHPWDRQWLVWSNDARPRPHNSKVLLLWGLHIYTIISSFQSYLAIVSSGFQKFGKWRVGSIPAEVNLLCSFFSGYSWSSEWDRNPGTHKIFVYW